MKSVVIALGIVAIIVGGSIVYTNHLDNTSEKMLQKNDIITEHINNEDYQEAVEEIKSLTEYVSSKRAVLDAVGNHQELDDIEGYLAELMAFAKEEDKKQSLSKCYKLDFLIKSLPRNFKLKIENIL